MTLVFITYLFLYVWLVFSYQNLLEKQMVAELLKNRFKRILNNYLLVSLPPFSTVISAFQLCLHRWRFYQPCLVPSFDFWGLKNRQKYRKLYNHSFSLNFWNQVIMCSLLTTCFREKWKMALWILISITIPIRLFSIKNNEEWTND